MAEKKVGRKNVIDWLTDLAKYKYFPDNTCCWNFITGLRDRPFAMGICIYKGNDERAAEKPEIYYLTTNRTVDGGDDSIDWAWYNAEHVGVWMDEEGLTEDQIYFMTLSSVAMRALNYKFPTETENEFTARLYGSGSMNDFMAGCQQAAKEITQAVAEYADRTSV